MSGRAIMAGGASLTPPIPKSPHARGDLEDAKFYAVNYLVPANSSVTYDVDATAFFVDDGPVALGTLEFSVDDCFPDVGFRYALFVRLRRFTRLHLRNLSGVDQAGRVILSRNPDFLIMQYQT